MHRPKPEDLHESADHQTDLQKAEILSRADARAVSETEVQNVLGGTALFGENIPSIWCKGVRRIPRQPRVNPGAESLQVYSPTPSSTYGRIRSAVLPNA